MKKNLLLFASLLLLAQACKKKDQNQEEPPAGTKLVKEKITEGADSYTLLYNYAADGKFSSLKVADGANTAEFFRIGRNAAGLVETVTMPLANPANTVVTVRSSGGRYTGAEWTVIEGQDTFVKKMTIVCDADGRITETAVTDYFSGTSPDPALRTTYAYAGNNLVSKKEYPRGGTLYGQTAYEYDGKTNPAAFGNDWILLSAIEEDFDYAVRASANNCTKATVTTSGSPTETQTFTYTYTAQNRPATYAFTSSNPVSSPARNGTLTYE